MGEGDEQIELFALLDHVIDQRLEDIADDAEAGRLLVDISHALSISFALGSFASGDRTEVEELKKQIEDTAESRQRGGKHGGGKTKFEKAEIWRKPGKQIWFSLRGQFDESDPNRQSQTKVAEAIIAKVAGLGRASKLDSVKRTIRRWDRGEL